MEGVKLDMWGYEVRTSSDSCISAINSYYHQVLSYGRERSVILEALVHDKDCVLANILAASFLCSSDPSRAPSHIQAAKSLLEQATKYEKAVFDAVIYLISQDRDDDVAVELYFKLLKDFPRDLVSLKRAQVLCFYMARADLSLDLVQQVLPINQEENYIYGMLAFPLLELGKMADAEKAAKKGFEINKQDYWAQHALCHVLQYECHFKEAVEFMEGCSSSWSSCGSFMLTHNWWHVALCYLEGSSPIQRVLEIYDHCILKELERSDAACPEVYLNAVGLLLRLYVRGEIDAADDRLKILAGCLTDEVNWYIEWHFDCLILWALASTGELSKAEDLLKGLKSRFSRMSKKKQQKMHRGMLLAEALYEYGRGNDKEALQLLGPDFDANNCKVIGASDEQVDVFNEIWYSTLLNTGQAVKAIEVIEKQIKKREGVPFLWRLLERAYNLAGKKEAAIIGEKARALETAYFK
ncbi:tetratricopeptide repeat protein 38 [Quercus lobata]|uniref:Tetratricopeptide repeat protein 38 n=1 Tax=Quercus lobata TaxID=97700 RepID=A0A7N2LAG1_QUELO|nr:tetratricopeptide repeat protein 38 [Quercus lobata]